ncbi:phage terminase large subunit family protein [Bradyrhizobium ottawaense]|nr:phage terminase large subunit family protein [Bradyrhizobium ottawaense]GMP00226.1 phage terminase large subunit family protein [Bradyrhizobium ottawaense]GMP11664.1 phage terminase large subunit family protein [Bradyrhizobium ottawaense]GMP15815.1 phage terminase large subunit family protein [Bradyrhizobium ottawaense]
MNALCEIRTRALRSLIPPPRLQLSDWIEANIRLPEGVSALPGAIRLYPYQREIADAISDPEIERVTMVKAARLGFTTLLSGAVGAYVANEPSPIMCLLPTDSDARDYVVSDIEPIFAASPALKGVLSADTEEGERNTLTSKRFAGGSLKVIAARSPRNLRRHTVRVLFVDEADACEAGPEGNPLRLAERRTLSFPNRKIVIGSTPLLEDTSNVLRSYALSDQRVFEVPCPECGGFTEIKWQHIEWPADSGGEGAAFRCPHCQALIDERFKAQMVADGEWRAMRLEVKGHAGFRLNALVSLLANASWSKLAAEFIAGKDDPAEMQTFVNTVLGEGWAAQGTEIDETSLAGRVEPFSANAIPPEVLAITVGADVQDDRIEATICGWTRDGVALVLGHTVIWGAFTDDTTWLELDELLKTRWKHPHGGWLKVDAAVIDAGDGDHADLVLNFCGPRVGRRVFAGKGASGTRPGFQISRAKKAKTNRLAIIGVDVLKSAIFDRLARGSAIRFSNSLEGVYFEQLASERRVIRYKRGQPSRRFERIPGRRAEALDALVYAYAARQAVQINFDQRASELAAAPVPPPPTVIRSEWMSR